MPGTLSRTTGSTRLLCGRRSETWTVAQAELDRLLRLRIDDLFGRMSLGLALIGVLAGVSILIAVLTHRHIVRPLVRLEAVASTVRETKDYSLRAEYSSQDEIGRVTAAFNDMLSELDAARMRETVERAEVARVAKQTTMGEMAASIAHEVNQPLAAIRDKRQRACAGLHARRPISTRCRPLCSAW